MASDHLQSSDHRKLLDVVDRLRLLGISHSMSLPQIVVCGDQSSGKSSVLEAISGMEFPTKDTLCTRFATEMILRRGKSQAVKVSIIPGEDRTPAEKAGLFKFKYDFIKESCDLSGAIEAASLAMGITEQKRFSDDILRLEIQGPDQPHLTLVDLPGMYRSGNKEQSVSELPIVVNMVRKYMAEERSIVVAVVSASYEYVLQEILTYVEELDPQKQRTLGLITKPDLLPSGSDSEAQFIALAQNKDIHLQLGWHVLRNRDYKSRNFSRAERDAQESAFFKTGAWASLSPREVGIEALTRRLQDVLRDLILKNIPGLADEVDTKIEHCEIRLAELGVSRQSLEEQRRYINRVSSDFTSLLTAAIDGTYTKKFFGLAEEEEGYKKRLRAVVQNRLETFAEDFRTRGHAQRIVEHDDVDKTNLRDGEISRAEYISDVKRLMKRDRGRELPGTFNPLIINELFQAQCEPWEELILEVQNDIMESIRWTVKAILDHVTVTETFEPLAAFLAEAITTLDNAARAYAQELLEGFSTRHPITYNHYLTDNVQKAQIERQRKAVKAQLNRYRPEGVPDHEYMGSYDYIEKVMLTIFDSTIADMGTYASGLAVDYMQAYYKVATKNIVDDISMHVIEAQLLDKLPKIFNQHVVSDLTDEQIEELAGERSDTAEERKYNTEKLERFRKGLEEIKKLGFRQLAPRGSTGLSIFKTQKTQSPDSASLMQHAKPAFPLSPAKSTQSRDEFEAPPADPDSTLQNWDSGPQVRVRLEDSYERDHNSGLKAEPYEQPVFRKSGKKSKRTTAPAATKAFVMEYAD